MSKDEFTKLSQTLERRFDRLDGKLAEHDKSFKGINAKLVEHDKTFEKFFKYMEKRFDDVDERFEDTNLQIRDIKLSISELVGHIKDYHQEMIMLAHKVGRLA